MSNLAGDASSHAHGLGIPQTQVDEACDFLDDVRKSGKTNMYGAAPLLEKEFGWGRALARKGLAEGMRADPRARTTGPRPTGPSGPADACWEAGLADADWGGAHAASAMDIIGSVGDYSTPEQFGRAGNRMSELVDQATSIKPPALYAKFHDALTQTDLYLQN